MSGKKPAAFSVTALFAEREAHHRQEKEAEEKLARRHQEELNEFKKRLEDFKITDDFIESVQLRIKRAFERGESELMLVSFPSAFCSDSGRAIINAGEPPIVAPSKEEEADAKDAEPDWLRTLPAGARPLYEFWKSELQPAGFGLSAQVINYPHGMPGDVGLFFTWPKSPQDV
jgi:hypothetical protein